jgi:hypothetical protein
MHRTNVPCPRKDSSTFMVPDNETPGTGFGLLLESSICIYLENIRRWR